MTASRGLRGGAANGPRRAEATCKTPMPTWRRKRTTRATWQEGNSGDDLRSRDGRRQSGGEMSGRSCCSPKEEPRRTCYDRDRRVVTKTQRRGQTGRENEKRMRDEQSDGKADAANDAGELPQPESIVNQRRGYIPRVKPESAPAPPRDHEEQSSLTRAEV